MLPSGYFIDYQPLLLEAREASVTDTSSFLQRRLPLLWSTAYVSAISHEPHLVRFRHGTFEYICDVYSQLEVTGAVPFDQTIADRVIGVIGKSSRTQRDRNTRRIRLGFSEELEETERDDGHFMAHSIGGGLDVNLFSQERRLNRGWSSQGKIYRQMEKLCCDQEGTFCFSRPIYGDTTNVPRRIEFGVLKTDETLWVEVFDN